MKLKDQTTIALGWMVRSVNMCGKLICVFLLACSLGFTPVFGQDRITSKDYEIYRQSLIDLHYIQEGFSVLVSNRTAAFDSSGGCASSLGFFLTESRVSREDPEFGTNFKKLPGENTSLEYEFGDDFEHYLVDPSELEKIGVRGGWESLRQRYPLMSGIVSFSGVVYSLSKDKAVLYLIFWKEESWLDGYYMVYSQGSESWKLLEAFKVWHLRPEMQ
ncbi:MAG: hypothetical protein J5I65_08360 [Aridibacter famidurans]|nr:hypothetical protein [Aridibacter famidurans]